MTIPTHGPIPAYLWQLAAVLAVTVFERINRPDSRPATGPIKVGSIHV